MDNQAEFTFACPHCGQHLEAESDMVGMELECPTCGNPIVVQPASSATSNERSRVSFFSKLRNSRKIKEALCNAKTFFATAATRIWAVTEQILNTGKDRWNALSSVNKRRFAITAISILALCVLIPRMSSRLRSTRDAARLKIKALKDEADAKAYSARCQDVTFEEVMRHPELFIGKDVCVRTTVVLVQMPDSKSKNHRGHIWAHDNGNGVYDWVFVYDDERTAFPDGNILKGDHAIICGNLEKIGHWTCKNTYGVDVEGDCPKIQARLILRADATQTTGGTGYEKSNRTEQEKEIEENQRTVPDSKAATASPQGMQNSVTSGEGRDFAMYIANGATIINGITWRYSVSDGEASIENHRGNSWYPAIPTSTSGAIMIPSTLHGYPVTKIAEQAFKDCNRLTYVVIPECVTKVGFYAFKGCSALTSVKIPNSVVDISISAFDNCNDALFDRNTIPGVKLVDGWAVGYESSLSGHLDLKHVRGIACNAFDGCAAITSVTIPDSVRRIAYGVFKGCGTLSSVRIPNSVTSISSAAFKGCNDMLFDKTTIPGVKLVDGWIIGYEPSLSGSVNLKGVRGIANSAFEGCSTITSVIIPNSVTSIKDHLFDGCKNLTSVTIPTSVTRIGHSAFKGCNALLTVEIPDSVTRIEYGAFKECSSLKSILIPSSVTSIGNCAFKDCTSLTSVTISDSVKSIGENAFDGCTSLKSLPVAAIMLMEKAREEGIAQQEERAKAEQASQKEDAAKMAKVISVLGALTQAIDNDNRRQEAERQRQEAELRKWDFGDDYDVAPRKSEGNVRSTGIQRQGGQQEEQQREILINCPVCNGSGRLVGERKNDSTPCHKCRGTGAVSAGQWSL